MRVHVIYTSPEVQTENSEEICKDILNDIVDKITHDEEHDQLTLKRKHCADWNCTTSKRNDAQD